MRNSIVCAVLALAPFVAQAGGWSCRNNDLEIGCADGTCKAQAEGGFTPFDISVGADGRSLSICAYSGCWEGKPRVLKSGKHLLMSGRGLAWTGTSPDPADFIVAIDTGDRVGFIKGEGYAMPVTCTESK
jgi:hypothetical protein